MTEAASDLVEIKQEPDIKSDPDEVDTIEYTPPINLSPDGIFSVKVEKIEPEEDDENKVDQSRGMFNRIEPNVKVEPVIGKGHTEQSTLKVLKILVNDVVASTSKGTTKSVVKVAKKKKQHKCPDCSYVTRYSSHFKGHMRKHTGEKPFPCNHCPKRFTHSSSLRSHLKVHVTKDSLHCSICWQIFATKEEKVAHELTCKKRRYECHLCKKFTTSIISHLKIHMRVHSGERPFKCDLCMNKFARKSDLTKHMKLHTNPRRRPVKFQCSVCARNFFDQSEKDAHEMKCKCRRYECYLCQAYMTHLKKNLQSHIRVYHTRRSPFNCSLCEKRYLYQSDLKRHMKRIHNKQQLVQ